MSTANKGICQSCRKPGHKLYRCPFKKLCPRCGKGYVRHLQVIDEELESYGKLFFNCTLDDCCGYFKWDNAGSTSVSHEGQSSRAASNGPDVVAFEKGLAAIFERVVTMVPDEEDVEIDFGINMRIRRGKGKGTGNEH